MADLENLLLEAAGRTGSGRKQHSRPQSKRQREGSYSDDGGDSNDDDSDGPVFTNRKPSVSQVPLKKRFESTERDDDWSSHGGDDEDDDHGDHSGDDSHSMSSIGSDLYKDAADKKKLESMTELEREMILSERADKKNDRQLKKKARGASSLSEKKTTRSRKEKSPPLLARGRSSVNKSNKPQKDALNELRAKRKKQQDSEGLRRTRDAVSSGGAGGRDSSPVRRKPSAVGAISDSSSSESRSGGDSKDEGSVGGGELGGGSDDDVNSSVPKYENIRDITIRRSKLAKWFMEPFFEELIVGCFVRVGIGMRSGRSIYRLCMVRHVDASDPNKPYKLENRTTHKYLNVFWGNETTAANWQMARVSDSPPLEEEFDEWKREVERSGGRMPSIQEVTDKREAIEKTNTFVYSAATVKQMLQEKKSASSKPFNVAAEKDRLRREMEVAQSRRDDAEVERIRARLQELEASRQAKDKDSKAVRLAEMNRKNRAENFKNASELKPVNTSLKAGEAGYDPFSRRWTRSRNYYVSKPEGGVEEAAAVMANGDATVAIGPGATNGIGAGPLSEAGVAATAAALEAAADAGKLVDTSAPLDGGTELNSQHDFELPISLAGLQKYGGPQGAHLGFMARKQKIEATIGFRVPENDGRRHALTLTVSDYKRRRGLL